ncbi:MAG: hypothetical protein AAF921_00700 [Cyanobacteria bacterium P01_D01_bin.44]
MGQVKGLDISVVYGMNLKSMRIEKTALPYGLEHLTQGLGQAIWQAITQRIVTVANPLDLDSAIVSDKLISKRSYRTPVDWTPVQGGLAI